ncbi:NTP transferase domain-containing protein [Candidatus Sumerlaeota bacterium]|nr:NTP transferase domain-containing protein [Candidatus Sumerlaeota bacterium]
MKAVILAAGEGSRMRPLTYTVPKPLTQVAGKPILEWIIESVAPHVDGVILIVGHLRERIEAHFGPQWRGLSVTYVRQAEQRGTGHALQMCREALRGEERFFVIYGDNISAPEDMARCAQHPLSALAIRVPDPERYGIFKTDAEGHLTDLIEKPSEHVGDHANAGVYVFDHRIFEELDRTRVSGRGEVELTDAVLALAKRAPMQVVDVTRHWLPIGYRDDVVKAEPILLGRDRGPAEYLAQRKRTIVAVLGVWRRRLDALLSDADEARAAQAPAPGRQSPLGLLRHMITAERWLRSTAASGQMGGPNPPTEAETPDLAGAHRLLTEERARTLAFLDGLDEAGLDRVCTLSSETLEKVYLTVEEMLLTLPCHECWHAGQISWALKMLENSEEC